MTTLMVTIRDGDTSDKALFQLITDGIDVSYQTGALFVSCRKRGEPFRKCKEGYSCRHVYHWSGDEYNPDGDWVNNNGSGPVCPHRHPGESSYSVVERLGGDPRTLRTFALYIRHPDPAFVVPKALKASYPAYIFREAARWIEPKMVREVEFKVQHFRWPIEPGTVSNTANFKVFGVDYPRRDIGFRSRYDHMSDSLNYLIDIQQGIGHFYCDWDPKKHSRFRE